VAALSAGCGIASMSRVRAVLAIRIVFVLLAGLGLSVTAVPLAAQAPATKLHRIGVLWPGGAPPPGSRLEWFREGLRESGFVEGQNIVIDLRYAEAGERLRALAGELVQSNVSVIATFGDLAPAMAQQATSVVPIVAAADDAICAGLVPSLARPGRNLTGVSILSPELSAKRLAVLKDLIPKLSRVAVLWDPVNRCQLTATESAARALSIKLQVLEVRGRDDLAGAFRAAQNGAAQALNVFASPLLSSLQQAIMDFAASHRLPAIYQWKEHATAGGLVSYGPSLAVMFRQTALVVAQVLKGANPASLPIEQPSRFELVINMKTGKALGLTIPPAFLLRADQRIE
jgi:putative tryptophan/tyrosine transport system substrate-binding protein